MTNHELLRAIGNKYSTEILEATDEPRSAQELSDDLGVPIATCYRRLDELADHDLLELHDEVHSDDRRRTKVYRRSVDEIRVRFSGSLSVDVDRPGVVRAKIDDIWEETGEAAG